MDAQGWVVIIAAVGMAVVQVIGAVFAGLAYYKGHVAAATAVEVKKDLAIADKKVETAVAANVVAERESKDRDVAIASAVESVKDEINGRMAELLRVTGESERAKGVVEGKAHLPPTQ